MKTILFPIWLAVVSVQVQAQTDLLFSGKERAPFAVVTSEEIYLGKRSLKVVDNGGDSEIKFVKLAGLDFKNGIIELEVAGKPSATAGEGARGFVGAAFRIAPDNSTFECLYLRPTNGRAEDQVRRNHSVQYISYPEFPWYKLRQNFPEKYESYVDLVPGEWTKIRIEVQGEKAKLYVHGSTQPVLLVNDLKHGAESHGAIGLWIGPGTEAHFANLSVTKMN